MTVTPREAAEQLIREVGYDQLSVETVVLVDHVLATPAAVEGRDEPRGEPDREYVVKVVSEILRRETGSAADVDQLASDLLDDLGSGGLSVVWTWEVEHFAHAPAPATPEVVTGAEAAELPVGSRVVQVVGNLPPHGASVLRIGRTTFPTPNRNVRYLVVHRASDPPPRVLVVGDEVVSPDLPLLVEHTALRGRQGQVLTVVKGELYEVALCCCGPSDPEDVLPGRIIDIPEATS